MNLDNCLDFAVETAEHVGKNIQLSGFRNDNISIDYKSRTDLLTNIDIESENYIVEKIKHNFPDHSIIAEEGNSIDNECEYIWHIDPLDGTNNFAHGIGHFCVSIGLFSKNLQQVLCGAVFDPLKNELFYAKYEGGSFLNNNLIRVSKITDIGTSIIATGFPYDKENGKINNIKQFSAVLPHIQGIRRMGSAALDLCYTACGRIDGYWEGMLNSWDICAGSLILTEAGGNISDYKGNFFQIFSKEVVATNGIIHKQLLNLIAENTDYYPNDI